MQAESKDAQTLCDELGITVLPTVQFWKEGAKLWEHRGIVALQQNVGEGAGPTLSPYCIVPDMCAITSAAIILLNLTPPTG